MCVCSERQPLVTEREVETEISLSGATGCGISLSGTVVTTCTLTTSSHPQMYTHLSIVYNLLSHW